MSSANPLVSAESRKWLLGLARHAIASAVAGEVQPKPETVPQDVTGPCGCFVSLHTASGELRGCIGSFEGTQPLWRNVVEMAVAAATRDPRFRPLSAPELGGCRLEISVLTPRRVAKPEEVVVGEHGIWISHGWARGVLLPQVAIEHGWDRTAFLEHTCGKAGLPRDAWREPDTLIEVFGAEVFGEAP